MKLRRFGLVLLATMLTLLALFWLFEITGWSRLFALPQSDQVPRSVLGALGVLLLVLDVFLPVPSSLIMLAHGTWFGVALGTALSALGVTLATLLGHACGRASSGPFARLITEAELERARALFARWGSLAIVVSRPVPILAETIAIAAGASGFPRGRAALAGSLGAVPASALYAWAGARGLDQASDLALFGLVLGCSTLAWFIGRRSAARAF